MRTPLSSDAAYQLLAAFGGERSIFGALNDEATLHGVGLGIDLGLLANFGSFRAGLSLRDVGGTPLIYKTSSFETVMSHLQTNLIFPEGNSVSDHYRIPMTINLGIAYSPLWSDSGSALDLLVHAEVRDLAGLVEGRDDILTHLHIGAELGIWRSIALRGGLSQGYPTFGIGFELSVVNLDLAYFTRELGNRYGEAPSSGLALELALRF
jgi:hypothetical protein